MADRTSTNRDDQQMNDSMNMGGEGSNSYDEGKNSSNKRSGRENNPGNFANDPDRASEAGQMGGSR